MLQPKSVYSLRRLTSYSIHRTRRLFTDHTLNGTGKNTSASSVNPYEISHFSRLSSQWWNEQGEFGLLHKMNPPRMQFIRDKLTEIAREDEGEALGDEKTNAEFLSGRDVLDVGCGGGILSEVRVYCS